MIPSANNWGIIGHEWAVDLLKRQLEADRLSHATLITGVAGIGKSLLALRLAQAINCENSVYPCLTCRPCTFIAEDKHVDFQRLETSDRSIKIEDVRDLIGFLSMKPYEARNRIILIRDFDKATGPAMDALLKTLEEPGPFSKVILTAESPHALLPTIVSRCQVFLLRPLPPNQIEDALLANGTHYDLAKLIASLSGGRIGWALEMARNPSALGQRAYKMNPITQLIQKNRGQRFALVEEMMKDASDNDITMLLANWLTYWRDVLLTIEGSSLPRVNTDLTEPIAHTASEVTNQDAIQIINTINETLLLISTTNANKRLALEVMMLKIPFAL